jgi:hypothetical protein
MYGMDRPEIPLMVMTKQSMCQSPRQLADQKLIEPSAPEMSQQWTICKKNRRSGDAN